MACSTPNGDAWADEAILENWDAIVASFPRGWLPQRKPDACLTGRPVYEEHGCGSYGCVYPTSERDVVFKITSDASEADFIELMRVMKLRVEGIVRYYRLYKIEGKRIRKHDGNVRTLPLYALARENADMVGKMDVLTGPERKNAQEVLGLLTAFKEFASAFRREVQQRGIEFAEEAFKARYRDDVNEYLDEAKPSEKRPGSKIRPGQVDLHIPMEWSNNRKASLAFQALDEVAQRMMRNPLGYYIGSALQGLLMNGLLLADVHHKNIGVVRRGRELAWVITDPGHLVRLDGSLPMPKIESV